MDDEQGDRKSDQTANLQSDTPSLAALLADADDDAFVELPAPFAPHMADRALKSLRTLRASFAERVEELRTVGTQDILLTGARAHSLLTFLNPVRSLQDTRRCSPRGWMHQGYAFKGPPAV